MSVGDLSYRLGPSRSCLVVVDVQWDFCGPRGDQSNEHMVAMADRLSALIGKARAASVPVIVVRTEHDERTSSVAWRYRSGSLAPELCQPGSSGAELFGIKEADADLIVTKHRFDAFIGTNLELALHAMGREAVVLTGTMTDICVETTCRHAVCADFFVTVVSDCCAAGSAQAHHDALARMERSFACVATSDEISRIWTPVVPLRGDPSSAGVAQADERR